MWFPRVTYPNDAIFYGLSEKDTLILTENAAIIELIIH